MNHSTLAVIPARGNSKGLPRKNLRLLGGKPLLVWSIEAALAARSITTVCVSTEDPEIADVARRAGAAVVARPARLAEDHVQNDAVVRHAVETLGPARHAHLALLQPTSPLRTAEHLDGCLALYFARAARSAMTVTPVAHHPGKSVTLSGDGAVEPFTTLEDMERRRQDMVPCYRQNGAVYVLGVGDFLAQRRFYLRPCAGYVMPQEASIDIDSELDLQMAELLLGRRAAPLPHSRCAPSHRLAG